MTKQHSVICQLWNESDRWSGQQSNGYSLHLTEDDRLAYIKQYNDSLPKGGIIPDVYSYISDTKYTVNVESAIVKKLQKVSGLRYFGDPPKDVRYSPK